MRIALLIGLLGALMAAGCKPSGSVDPEIQRAQGLGAVAIHAALETQIDSGGASEADRVAALSGVRASPDDQTAAYAYARASVAGRAAENRGLQALDLLEEMAHWAETSIARDPDYEGMAATRLLGTLHALAGKHLKKGDSERGLELLESVVAAHPDQGRNHLRLAEAFVSLGDAESGFESLCRSVELRADLRAEETNLLDRLLEEVGGVEAIGCAGSP